jgi:hypothetical protein
MTVPLLSLHCVDDGMALTNPITVINHCSVVVLCLRFSRRFELRLDAHRSYRLSYAQALNCDRHSFAIRCGYVYMFICIYVCSEV